MDSQFVPTAKWLYQLGRMKPYEFGLVDQPPICCEVNFAYPWRSAFLSGGFKSGGVPSDVGFHEKHASLGKTVKPSCSSLAFPAHVIRLDNYSPAFVSHWNTK